MDHAEIAVDPAPAHRWRTQDYFGTIVESFEVLEPHSALAVRATALVETHPPPDTDATSASEDSWVAEYLFTSPMVSSSDEVEALASSLRQSSTIATVHAAMSWLHGELAYEPGSTVVGTPVTEVIRARRGVCQDYAHTCCAVLRALKIPARYVSGYFVPSDIVAGERHVKVGHGRDYSDVIPFHGVHAGSAGQTLDVRVDIRRLG